VLQLLKKHQTKRPDSDTLGPQRAYNNPAQTKRKTTKPQIDTQVFSAQVDWQTQLNNNQVDKIIQVNNSLRR
jgi:hypothetical protein